MVEISFLQKMIAANVCLLVLIICLSVSLSSISMASPQTKSSMCPGKGGPPCQGCQCCPNGCLCPGAKNCPVNLCPSYGEQCDEATTTTRSVVSKYAITTAPEIITTPKVSTIFTSISPATDGTQESHGTRTFGPVTSITTAAPASGSLIFEDNFESLDFRKWKHELTLTGGGNWEFQMYHNNRSTSFAKNGVLHIKPGLTSDFLGSEQDVMNGATLDMWGGTPADQCTGNFEYGCMRTAGAGGNYLNPITSARLRTAESFSFRYGKVEIRAKLPKGDWLWPAIWMLPRYNEYGNWPASGEIDIMESRGNVNYPASAGGGVESFGSTLHFGPSWSSDHFESTHATHSLKSGTLNDQFHTFGLYWGPDRIYTYLDNPDNIVLDVPITETFWKRGQFAPTYFNPWQTSSNMNAPFDKEYYLIMNIAAGGISEYFPDGIGGKPWTNNDPHSSNSFYNAKSQW